MNLDQILSSIPKLSPEELEEVRQRVMALSAVNGVMVQDDWLLSGILHLLDDRGLGDTIPTHFKIINRRQFHGYLGKSEKVRNTIIKAIPNLKKLEKLSLGRILAKCLAGKIEEFRPVTLNAMLQHVDLTLSALDQNFPGYLQAGMLWILLRGLPSE
jgi:hypothetical protein